MESPIGIDFGTTFSSIYLYDNGHPNSLSGKQSNCFIPTLISIDDNGEWSFGSYANDMPGTIFDVKRMLGVPFDAQELKKSKDMWEKRGVILRKDNSTKEGFIEIQIHNSEGGLEWISPEEIAGRYLEWLYNDCVSKERDNRKIVVTIPANYTQAQRKATIEACKIARLNISNVTLIHEPTAAGLALSQSDSMKNETYENLLVIDFGGGTLDVALMKLSPKSTPCIEARGVEGEQYLGGRDFDKNLIDYVLEQLPKDCDIDDDDVMDINMKCIEAKENFSQGKDKIAIYKKGKKIGGVKLSTDILIERKTFDNNCKSLYDRFIQTIDRLLSEKNISYDNVDGVWLVGGSSNLVHVQEIIESKFPKKKLIPYMRKREAIAEGACYYAHAESPNSGKSMKVLEILTHSLGVKIFNTNNNDNPKFSPILKKNEDHTLSKKKIKYHTVIDNQTRIEVDIYECNTDYIKDGRFLAKYSIDVQPKPKGEGAIKLYMKIDENGILHTKAIEIGNEKNCKKLSIQYFEKRFKEITNEDNRDKNQQTNAQRRANLMNISLITEFIEITFPPITKQVPSLLNQKTLKLIDEIKESILSKDPKSISEFSSQMKELKTMLSSYYNESNKYPAVFDFY